MASRKQRAAARRNIKKARKKWMSMSSRARKRAMPGPYKATKAKARSRVIRYRMKKVKGHLIQIRVHKKRGPRGGRTTGRKVTKAEMKRRARKAIRTKRKRYGKNLRRG